jgi:hypothetical protein
MLKTIWETLKALAGSKKFQAAVLSAMVWGLGKALGKLGITNMPTAEDLVPFVGPLWLYVFGQGMADLGKEKAKIEAGK